MTLQQLEYIIALDKYRHFVLAAESCGITQPTMSIMIRKLEEELGVKIFERDNKNIAVTPIGSKIIAQAQIIMDDARKLKEIIYDEAENLSGSLKLGIIPTVAPYIIPDFIAHFRLKYPKISLQIDEMNNEALYSKIQDGEIDMGISTTPPQEVKLLEIPLYSEKFLVYFSESCRNKTAISIKEADTGNMWVLRDGHCMRNRNYNFCTGNEDRNNIYKAGSIENLVRIVDKNGGFTIIPELHTGFLNKKQLENIRTIKEGELAARTVSILIKPYYIREKTINAVAGIIREIIPENMQNRRLREFRIKL